ncbi:hypothetical protein Tco_0031177 [Tanacetum coccineum]
MDGHALRGLMDEIGDGMDLRWMEGGEWGDDEGDDYELDWIDNGGRMADGNEGRWRLMMGDCYWGEILKDGMEGGD